MLTRPTVTASHHSGRLALVALWLLIGLCLGSLALLQLRAQNAPPDAFAACKAGQQTADSTLVLIDRTDVLNDVQRRRAKTTIDSEAARLPAGGVLILLGINAADSGEPLEIAALCRPIAPSEVDARFETRGPVARRWQKDFAEPLASATAQAIDGQASSTSPILETIAAALTRPDFDARSRRRRLVIVSDLLQNTPALSQLSGGRFWAAYQRSTLRRDLPLDLRGVAVAVDYLVRPRYARIQGPAHRQFWTRLFRDAGASAVDFVGLAPVSADLAPPIAPALEHRSAR